MRDTPGSRVRLRLFPKPQPHQGAVFISRAGWLEFERLRVIGQCALPVALHHIDIGAVVPGFILLRLERERAVEISQCGFPLLFSTPDVAAIAERSGMVGLQL